MNHIEIWKDRKAEHEKQSESKRQKDDNKEEQTIASVKEWCTKHKVDFAGTNGYVYHLDYNGMSATVCNQKNRVVGHINRVLHSEEDRECFHDMESEMMRDKAPLFAHEYCYHNFCIQGKLPRVLGRVIKLINNMLIVTGE